ncbi:hypothetical protein B4098_2759 [Heyndrickxia coagulans]|uniref:Uncharacterized protein n=1 Tax=Heyndrickxia coagulans TaxID=1398 RepID=A0A150K494_HEYCO|nr:hypothetical protein B4098_2759 [Heyndrickxia coagulans]
MLHLKKGVPRNLRACPFCMRPCINAPVFQNNIGEWGEF